MSLASQFQTAFSSSLSLLGEDIVFTSRDAAATPKTLEAVITSIGPEDAAYKDRVASRFTVEFLAADLGSLTPQKRDRLSREATGETLEVYEVR